MSHPASLPPSSVGLASDASGGACVGVTPGSFVAPNEVQAKTHPAISPARSASGNEDGLGRANARSLAPRLVAVAYACCASDRSMVRVAIVPFATSSSQQLLVDRDVGANATDDELVERGACGGSPRRAWRPNLRRQRSRHRPRETRCQTSTRFAVALDRALRAWDRQDMRETTSRRPSHAAPAPRLTPPTRGAKEPAPWQPAISTWTGR